MTDDNIDTTAENSITIMVHFLQIPVYHYFIAALKNSATISK